MTDVYTKWLEHTTTWIFIALIINVFADVVLRYAFNNPIIGLQELEWHLFAAMFLIGISYGLQQNTHVRVDIFYDKFSQKTQSLINIIGFFIFIMPISVLIIYYGTSFSYDAFIIGESSGDPGGLAYRFIIKSIIPISFVLVLISGIIFITQNIKNLRNHSLLGDKC